jgi:type I restriction enzyme M protein
VRIDHFSVVFDKNPLTAKDYSFSAGQYFEIKSTLVTLSNSEFNEKVQTILGDMKVLFNTSRELEKDLLKKIADLTNE